MPKKISSAITKLASTNCWRRRRTCLCHSCAFLVILLYPLLIQAVIVNTNRQSQNNKKQSSSPGVENGITGGSGTSEVSNSGSNTLPYYRVHTDYNPEDYAQEQTNDERRLYNYLMRNYDNTIRPVLNASTPITVRLGITLTQIFDLDEKNQVLTTNVWLDQEWIDEFLTWNSSDFGDIQKIRIPCQSIWLPDIVLYNNAEDYTRGYMNSRAVIEPNGNVFWPPPTKFRSTCEVDVTYFPFDDQTCSMRFGSWIYDGLQVNIVNRTTDVDLENYKPNGEWDLLSTSLVRRVITYPCCPEEWPILTLTVVIRRKILYYTYNVILPCIMMSALTLLVFCLPPESGEKIALGVTVLLAFSVFMLAISEKLPETSVSIPLLGVYLTVVMGITSISIIMTVVVLNFHYVSPVNKKELPEWLRNVIQSQSILDQHFQCNQEDISDGEDEKDEVEVELKETIKMLNPADNTGPYQNETFQWNNSHHKIKAIPPPVPFQQNTNSSSSSVNTAASSINLLNRHHKIYNLSSNENMKLHRCAKHQYGYPTAHVHYSRTNSNCCNNRLANSNTVSSDNFKVDFHHLMSEQMQNHSVIVDDPSGASAGGGMSRNLVNTVTPYVLCAAATRLIGKPFVISDNEEFKQRINEENEDIEGQNQCIYNDEYNCEDEMASRSTNQINELRTNVRHRRFSKNENNKSDRRKSLPRPSHDSASTCSSNLNLEQEVKRMLSYVRHRQEMEDATNRRIHEWRLLSMFIDKILFWIFLVVTVLTSVTFLVIIPIQRRGI